MSLISVTDLTKKFDDFTAVDTLSFEVGAGEVVGLLGANGAGKTTAMKVLLGLMNPSSGRVSVNGQPFGQVDRRHIGYVPQGLGLYNDLTVAENLRFVAAGFGVDVPSLERAGLAHLADKRISEVSLGVKRRLAFLASGCHNPKVLILDEPTSGVGPLGRARLWETIHDAAEAGAAVLVSTHYMDEAEECDRVVLLANGREMVSGSVAEVLAGITAVEVAGDIGSDELESIKSWGGTSLAAVNGWRIVGLSALAVREIVGPGVNVESVPATFEEVFVTYAA